jgi:hypothetical protein
VLKTATKPASKPGNWESSSNPFGRQAYPVSKIPVLLLISRDIDLYILNHSSRFQSYHFFSLTAIDYLGKPSTIPASQRLQIALKRKIRLIRAQFLLAHLGFAFYRYPVEFLTAVMEIQSLHPQLKMGFDKGINHAIQYLQLFATPSPEVTRLSGRIIQNRSTLEIDREMATLASCLY